MELILKETNILGMISAILRAPDNIEPETIRYMKLEATWIQTNITFAEEDVIELMMDEQYDFINHFNLILEGADGQMIDQVIWLIANISATSHSLKKKMLSNTYIIQQMSKFVSQHKQIKKGHFKTILWCCSNLAQPSVDEVVEHLTEEEILSLVYIFGAAIELESAS